MPDFVAAFRTRREAVETLVDMFDLSERQARELRAEQSIGLVYGEHGAEHAEFYESLCEDAGCACREVA